MHKYLIMACLVVLVACDDELPDDIQVFQEPELVAFDGNIAEFLSSGTDVSEVQRYLGEPLQISSLAVDKQEIYGADEARTYRDPNNRRNEYQVIFQDKKLVRIWLIKP